jgi:hypothetical protein
VGFWINYGVNTTLPPSHSQWLIPFAVQLIPAGLLLAGCLWIPESPRWLMEKGHREKGLEVLCWMRKLQPSDIYIKEELSYIEADLDRFHAEVGTGFWKPFGQLRKKRLQWKLFLGALLFVFQNGSGINAINYYRYCDQCISSCGAC